MPEEGHVSGSSSQENNQSRKKLLEQVLPQGERSVLETLIHEHGVAVVLDELSQLCDEIARRPNTTRKDFHVFSLLSIHLNDQVVPCQDFERLQERS